ncbi:MAG: phosphatase PAP2 family protein [Candidatus Bilamarchaeaceae archaeon]
MDIITQFAHTMNSGLLASVSSFLDNDIIYLTFLLLAIVIGERRPQKIAKIVLALALGVIIGTALKIALAVERPCVSLGLDYCPQDYSLPSLHALTAFILMISFLNKNSFIAYALLALFISLTRLVLAVHSFRDISAALALALIIYHLIDSLWKKENKIKNKGTEDKRQIFHMIVAIVAIAILFFYGKGVLMGATFVILLIGLILVNQAYLGKTNPLVDWFIKNFEREGTRFPGWGSACYATGVLFMISMIQNPLYIAAGLIIIGFGDAFSTLVGIRGKIKLPYNKNKTLEGFISFFLSSIIAFFFIGPLAFLAGLAGAIVESLPLPFDDNITIACALTLLFLLV